jgi:hypothetical protein
MLNRKLRGLVLTCAVAAAVLAVPADSSACCDWLFGGWGARTTYSAPAWASSYAPAYYAPACTAPTCSAPACSSCVSQSVGYAPQTVYRTVYQQTPVTTYAACTSCDACTGCPVTYYRPITTWAYRATLMPYTTYRVVYSNGCSSCGSCSTCYSGCSSSGCSSCGCSSSGCSSCAAGVGATLQTNGACCTPATTTGTATGGTEGTRAPETFKQSAQPSDDVPSPTPDPNTSSNPGPSLTDPASRTALRPSQQATQIHLISAPPQPGVPQPKADIGNWRISRD